MMSELDRLLIANKALQTFCPSVRLYRSDHPLRLRMAWGKYDFPAHLRNDGSWPMYGYRQRPTGGTGFQAIAQLIRYVRDLSRLPLMTWEYWSSDTVKLTGRDTVTILRDGNYADPLKTCCVLCGDSEFKRGLDWWSLDGKIGPCCGRGCAAQPVGTAKPESEKEGAM